MQVTVKHQSELYALAERFQPFGKLWLVDIEPSPHRQWRRPDSGGTSHDLQVVVLGKSGYGKSSLINALTGGRYMQTSDVAACTRTVQCVDYRIREGHYLSLADLPGLGESADRDAEYLPLYARMLAKADLTLYVLRADSRDLAIDEQAFARLFPTPAQRARVILVVTACDKAAPVQRAAAREPSPAQMQTIEARLASLRRQFPDVARIVPCSADTGWNLERLCDTLVEQLLCSEGVTDLAQHFTQPLIAMQRMLKAVDRFMAHWG